jgi:hypothetical protein
MKCFKPGRGLPSVPPLRRNRHKNLYEFETSLVYILSSKPARDTQWDLVIKKKKKVYSGRCYRTGVKRACCSCKLFYWLPAPKQVPVIHLQGVQCPLPAPSDIPMDGTVPTPYKHKYHFFNLQKKLTPKSQFLCLFIIWSDVLTWFLAMCIPIK